MVYAVANTELGGWIWRVCYEQGLPRFRLFSKKRQHDITVWQECQQI